MITDEERREIANELRHDAKRLCASTYAQEFGIYVADIIDPDYKLHYDMMALRLADLIDRPTCHNVADPEKESFRCSRCGCRVLALGSMPENVLVVTSEAFPVDWYSCPVCGAVVLDGTED